MSFIEWSKLLHGDLDAAPGSQRNPLPVQCKMDGHSNYQGHSKHHVQVIWNAHIIMIIPKVKRPGHRPEYGARDEDKPYDPVHDTIGAQLALQTSQGAPTQSLEPILVPDNVRHDANQSHQRRTNMSRQPHIPGNPQEEHAQFVRDNQP